MQKQNFRMINAQTLTTHCVAIRGQTQTEWTKINFGDKRSFGRPFPLVKLSVFGYGQELAEEWGYFLECLFRPILEFVTESKHVDVFDGTFGTAILTRCCCVSACTITTRTFVVRLIRLIRDGTAVITVMMMIVVIRVGKDLVSIRVVPAVVVAYAVGALAAITAGAIATTRLRWRTLCVGARVEATSAESPRQSEGLFVKDAAFCVEKDTLGVLWVDVK